MVKVLNIIFWDIPNFHGPPTRRRDAIITDWEPFFRPYRYSSDDLNAAKDITFPALQVLTLDFERLNMEDGALTVSPLMYPALILC